MCTIGNSFWTTEGHTINTIFKQCDLVDATIFIEPVVRQSQKGIKYVAFTREKKYEKPNPAWAGVNEYGVSFVAADSYLKKNENGLWKKAENKPTVFETYLTIITNFRTAKEALIYVKAYYETYKSSEEFTDILMISDQKESYFIETLNGVVRIIKRTNGHFVSTNHCRMFYGTAPYDQNHSTFLRLNRAEALLQKRDDNTGIGDLLRDSYYGKTVWSICRYASVTDQDIETSTSADEDMFFTQAAVIFTLVPNNNPSPKVICEYVINGNAKDSTGYVWCPFENTAPQQVCIGKNENLIKV